MMLERCLDALGQAPAAEMECIVVDDGSMDGSAQVALRAALTVRLIRLPLRRGAAAARNIGARQATGDILVFIDADVCVHADTLKLMARAFEENAALGAVMGAYDDAPSEPGFHSQYRNLLHCYVHRSGRREACTFWTGCGAIRREIFDAHGGFDEAPHTIDDVELGARLSRAGVRIELRPDIQVQHRKTWTLGSTVMTDIWLRGVPWTLLLWRDRRMPNVLNLDMRNRVSVALVWLAAVALGMGKAGGLLCALAAVLLGSALWANRGLYRFFSAHGGTVFAVQSAACHLLHLFNCGISFGLGSVMFAARAMFTGTSAPAVAEPLKVADE